MTLSELSNFYYNADHQRILQDATKGTYWSAGDGSFERLWDRSDSRETYKYQLRVGDRSVGYLRQTYYTNGSNIDQRFYTLTDHLGSIQAVIGADGRKLQSLSFSAWGERRAADWNPSGIATPALDLVRNYGLTHGFTGHEADEPWGLINMKGRLYDPVVGRFLSADPFIQFTDNTQSYNRYTYVLNNPLSFTDPSGYHVLDDIFDFVTNNIRTIIAIGVGIVTGGGIAAGLYGGMGTLAGGAVGAFTTTLIASVEAALRAGVFGALSAGLAFSVGHGAIAQVVGNQSGAYIAHGVAQGVVSVLQGDKFGHGFASGFFGHLAGGVRAFGAPGTGSFSAMMGRTLVAAVVGGTVSQITGGTFANGAMTAAFVHLFNAEGVNDEDISGFENSSALEDFVKIFRLDLMDGDSAGIFKIPVGAVANVGSGGRFEGVGAPWRDGATPNSVYTQYSGKSGVAIKNAIYDADGKYVGEVNFRNHGNGYVSGHGHVASTPGDIPSAHLPQNHLMPKDIPAGWSDLLNGRLPHTLLGD